MAKYNTLKMFSVLKCHQKLDINVSKTLKIAHLSKLSKLKYIFVTMRIGLPAEVVCLCFRRPIFIALGE